MVIEFPPVKANLLGLVDRANQQTNPDREEFDFGERHFDVARDDEAFVEHAVQDVDEPGRPPVRLCQWHRHSFGILREPSRRTRAPMTWLDANGNLSISATEVPATF